ncbi:alpha/beta fold hydrolase [Cupriavidus sp. 2TAF22]|uniref:alpha/beta fold hydrolase n=1 Tax=unclassified Cupriavidus TaxID=2640874 RepID=UPI003F8FF5CF
MDDSRTALLAHPAASAPPDFDVHPARGGLPGWREAGNGPALLLLHGWSLSGEAFDGQRALAQAGLRVIAPDHAGHGLSAALPQAARATVARLAADVAALVRHLGLREVTVAGWSMGAMAAWELLRSHAALPLAAVGAIDMTPCLVTGPDWQHGLHGRYDTTLAAQMAARVRQDWPATAALVRDGLWAAGSQPDLARATWLEAVMGQCAPQALASLWEDMARRDYRQTLAQTGVPLFHLYGERSRLYAPAVGQATQALQPAARLAIVPGTGHAPHMERPEAFNTALLAMLSGAAAGWRP